MEPASFNAIDHQRLSTNNGACTAIESNDHARLIPGGGCFLLDGPLERVVHGELTASGQHVAFLKRLAYGNREAMILLPGGADGKAAVESGASCGGLEVSLGSLVDVAALALMNPSHGVKLSQTFNGLPGS